MVSRRRSQQCRYVQRQGIKYAVAVNQNRDAWDRRLEEV
jgi:hypothetical protein